MNIKHTLALLAIHLLLASSIVAQSCLPGGLTLTNQAQVNSFPTDHPGCTTIEGFVRINYVSDLTPLSQITSIEGYVQIGTNQFSSFNGLHNLTHVGGYLRIEGNMQLNDMSALSNLTSVGGVVEVRANNALTSLSGLENLATIGGDLEVTENAGLTDLQGLEGLTDITGGLLVMENPALTSMQGLAPTSLGGSFNVMQNPLLADLVAAHDLTSVGGGLGVRLSPALTSLLDLQTITSINGGLAITGCTALTSLDGVDQISSSSITNLSLAGCTGLSQCAVASICGYLADPANYVNLHSNGPGCANRAEVEAACALLSVDDAIQIDEALNIYPNPSTGLVMLRSDGNADIGFKVFDMAGRSVHQERLSAATEGSHTIDLSHLPPGFYTLRIQRGQSFSTTSLLRH